MTPRPEPPHQDRTRGRLVLGIFLILFGLLFLAYRLRLLPEHFPFGLLPVDEPWRLWPMILVAVGLGKLATHGLLQGKGHFLIGLGVAFQAVMLEREDLVETWWPLLLVWWGLITILRALNSRVRPAVAEASADPAEPASHD